MKKNIVLVLAILCGAIFYNGVAKGQVNGDGEINEKLTEENQSPKNNSDSIARNRRSYRVDTIISVLDDPNIDTIKTLKDEELNELFKKYFNGE